MIPFIGESGYTNGCSPGCLATFRRTSTRPCGASPAARESGSIDIRARSLDDFAGLNRRLNEGGVFGGRGFVVKTGDLAIGDELRANRIEVSADGGSLTVNGRIDASGEDVGSIRLAGRNGLTLGGSAVLDAHGTVLRVDSRGQIIDAPNRAMVELDGGQGTLTLAGGARRPRRFRRSGRCRRGRPGRARRGRGRC